jgi:hypothetical protein
LFVIFFLRNYLLIVLLPCMVIGYLMHRFPRRKRLILFLAFIVGAVTVFGGKYIHPALNIPSYISDNQTQFSKLAGSSLVERKPLEPGLQGFVSALPSALDMGFLRPHPSEKGFTSLIASLEMIGFWILFFVCLARSKSANWSPIMYTCILFGLITLLIIGYTVPFSGAVVRYRALVLPFILAPAVAASRFHLNYKK